MFPKFSSKGTQIDRFDFPDNTKKLPFNIVPNVKKTNYTNLFHSFYSSNKARHSPTGFFKSLDNSSNNTSMLFNQSLFTPKRTKDILLWNKTERNLIENKSTDNVFSCHNSIYKYNNTKYPNNNNEGDSILLTSLYTLPLLKTTKRIILKPISKSPKKITKHNNKNTSALSFCGAFNESVSTNYNDSNNLFNEICVNKMSRNNSLTKINNNNISIINNNNTTNNNNVSKINYNYSKNNLYINTKSKNISTSCNMKEQRKYDLNLKMCMKDRYYCDVNKKLSNKLDERSFPSDHSIKDKIITMKKVGIFWNGVFQYCSPSIKVVKYKYDKLLFDERKSKGNKNEGEKSEDWITNINPKDIYKMYNLNKKNEPKLFTAKLINDMRRRKQIIAMRKFRENQDIYKDHYFFH